VGALGSGSDYTSFLDHFGVASLVRTMCNVACSGYLGRCGHPSDMICVYVCLLGVCSLRIWAFQDRMEFIILPMMTSFGWLISVIQRLNTTLVRALYM
jgi:hypothetical protein